VTILLSDLREPPVVGRFYMVPAIYYRWNGKDGHWPVVGPLHEDVEFFGFRPHHYHVDLRFLTASQFKLATRSGWRRPLSSVMASDAEHAVAAQPLACLDLPIPRGRPALIRRRCRLSSREYAFPNEPAIQKLNEHYGSPAAPIRLCDGRLLCPHRKADLSTYAPDANGVVTCPLHGLRVQCAQ
jgi:hypothetical protein